MLASVLSERAPISFDCIPTILTGRDKRRAENGQITGEIYYSESIDDIKSTLLNIIDCDSESIKIGILYKRKEQGHVTPIFIEKVVYNEDDGENDDEEKPDEIYIYHTDSVVFEFDGADALKDDLKSLATYGKVIVLGYDDPKKEIMLAYKRQHDHFSCVIFSLLDIEQMFNVDFREFALQNSDQVEDNLYTLKKLPASFMYVMQSVEGEEQADGTFMRKGLKQYIAENQAEANKVISILDVTPSVRDNIRKGELKDFVEGVIQSIRLDQNIVETWFDAIKTAMAAAYRTMMSSGPTSQTDTTLKILYERIDSFFQKKQSKARNLIISLYEEYYFNIYNEDLITYSAPKLQKLNINHLDKEKIFSLACAQASYSERKAEKQDQAYQVTILVGMLIIYLTQQAKKIDNAKKSSRPHIPFAFRRRKDKLKEQAIPGGEAADNKFITSSEAGCVMDEKLSETLSQVKMADDSTTNQSTAHLLEPTSPVILNRFSSEELSPVGAASVQDDEIGLRINRELRS